jgi:geranylgeranyl reductase family protein
MGSHRSDVLVVGAGPAGATAAFILATQGLRVTLLDRREFPRPKLCGGLLTWKTIKVIEEVFHLTADDLKAGRVIHCESRSYLVAGPSGRGVVRTLDFPFHLVEREAYDHLFLERAIRAGVAFHPGRRVVSVDPQRKEILTAGGETHRGRFILGADGVHSLVRKSLERGRRIPTVKSAETAAALEVFVPNEAVAGFPDPPAIFYGHLPWGYAWSFPGNGHRVLGIAGLRTRSGRRLRSAFAAFAASLSLPRGLTARIAGHSLPYGNYLETPGHGSTLLVGDAAGLADPFLGEGLYYAHRSAALAAAAIMEADGLGRTAAGSYAERIGRTILPELRYARAGRNLVFSLPPRLYYPVLGAALRLAPKVCEQTIQGQRSFRWFRKTDRLAPDRFPPAACSR